MEDRATLDTVYLSVVESLIADAITDVEKALGTVDLIEQADANDLGHLLYHALNALRGATAEAVARRNG